MSLRQQYYFCSFEVCRREYGDVPDDEEEEEARPAKKKGGRKTGSKTVERILYGEFATKKGAIKAGKEWLGGNCTAQPGNSWNYEGQCVSHECCLRHFIVKPSAPQRSLPSSAADYDGSWCLFVPVKDSVAKHSESQILVWKGKGVQAEFRTELAMYVFLSKLLV